MDVTRDHIQGIVFDKDGTLFDFTATWGSWARSVIEAETQGDPGRRGALAQALGYDLVGQRFAPESIVIAATAEEIADIALPFLEAASVDEVLARWNVMAAAAPQVEATPLVPFLSGLKARGLALGVATNDAETPARAHLDEAGVAALFDFIAGYDSGHGGKPAPGQLLAFCAETGVAPENCVMVGDSTHDLHAGRAAGMTTVAVLTGVATSDDLAPHADVVLHSIAALPAWLDGDPAALA